MKGGPASARRPSGEGAVTSAARTSSLLAAFRHGRLAPGPAPPL